MHLALASAGDFSARVVCKELSKDLIYVDRTWRKDLPLRLKVGIRAGEETPCREVVFKAYFFDASENLIDSQAGPNLTWTQTNKGIGEVGMPELIASNKTSYVYLALPEKLKSLRTTIIVFGKQGQLVASIYPCGKLDKFNFPEKAEVLVK